MGLLDSRQSVQYLIDRKILSVSDAISLGVEVEDRSGRNRNHLVTVGDTSWLMKQPKHRDSEITLQRERQMLERLNVDPNFKWAVPRPLAIEPPDMGIILESPSGGQDLSHRQRYRTLRSKRLADLLGRLLGDIHCGELNGHVPVAPLPASLFLVAPTWDLLDTLSPMAREFVRILQSRTELCEFVDTKRQMWEAYSPIHGDVRWSNVVVWYESHRLDTIMLIDWELSGLGMPKWDIASVWAAKLVDLVTRMSMRDEASRGYLTSRIQSWCSAFWTSYEELCRSRGIDPPTTTEVADLVPLRLVQAAFEYVDSSPERMHPMALRLLQLAANTHESPFRTVGLLGLPIASQHVE